VAAPLLVTAALYQAPWLLSSLLWGQGPVGIDPLAVLHVYALHLPFHVLAWITYVITMASALAPAILSVLRLRRSAILAAAVLLIWARRFLHAWQRPRAVPWSPATGPRSLP